MAVSIKDITIFKYLSEAVLKQLKELFSPYKIAENEVFVESGDEMAGIFLIVEGSLDIFTDGFREKITTLNIGASVGEMSLVSKNGTSSASIRGGSQGATLMGCTKLAFQKMILNDEYLAYQFYKGTSELLAERLLQTNNVLNEKIEQIRFSIKKILDEYSIINRVEGVMGAVDQVGSEFVKKLQTIVEFIDSLMVSDSVVGFNSLQKVKKDLEDIMLIDMQTFDRMYQKLGLIMQYLANLQGVLLNEGMKDVHGDQKLFD